MLKLHAYNNTYHVTLKRDNYMNNNNLYLGLNDDEGYPFTDITVNIENLPENYACIDVNNNPFIIDFLTRYGIGEDAGLMMESGFCVYPVFRIDTDRVENIIKAQEQGIEVDWEGAQADFCKN